MTPPSPEFYSQWRDARLTEALHDTPSSPPPERLLQAIWQHQRLHRDALQTIEGLPLRVLHPGFLNHEAGPDFYQAVIQVGENQPAAGDVEVDPLATDWYSHGHATNPAFAGVILHVIWNGPAKTALPTLRIQPHSDAPIKDLAAWQETEPPYPVEYTGQCYAPLSKLTLDSQDNLLRQAALVRLKTKSESFTRLAHCHGWDAALWRGLFRALGYKHNTWPMQNLAERLPALRALGPTNSCGWQARLLGLSGLLTDDLPGQTPAARQHLRQLWNHWWRERDTLAGHQLPKTLWRFAGLRPANHPARRLALLGHWLAYGDFLAHLQIWLETDSPKTKLASTLTEILQVKPDKFWLHHWTFKSARQSKPCPLIGITRITDLAINAILPWFHARARAGKNRTLLPRIENRYTSWPPAQDNSVLKLACQRLFGGPRRLSSAAHQQGLLQIVSDFCDHVPATCNDCPFPALILAWQSQPKQQSITP